MHRPTPAIFVILALLVSGLPGCDRATPGPAAHAAGSASQAAGADPSPVPPPEASKPEASAAAATTGAAPTADTGASADRASRPSVLLVIVDTLRADRLPAYGFTGGKAPTLDRLAAQGVLFERAIAAAAATVPSHASLFTSRFVRQHAVGSSNGDTRLADEKTLADGFRDAGYATAAFISNIMINRHTGLARGFDLYDDRVRTPERNRPDVFERTAPQTTRAAIRWLEANPEPPVFLVVHYQDPHGPYTPPPNVLRAITAPPTGEEPTLAVNATQSGYQGIPAYQALPGLERPGAYEHRYVGEILYMDRWLRLLLQAFEKHRSADGHIIAVTSDHGESLGEDDHWFAHGHTSTPDLAHIPLLLRAPGLEPQRISSPVSHVDVLPTLLELAGVPVPEGSAGLALGPYVREKRPLPERKLYCDLGPETGIYDERGFTRVRFSSDDAAARGDLEGSEITRYAWPKSGAWVPSDEPHEVGADSRAYLAEVTPQRFFFEERDTEQIERLRALGYIEPDGDTLSTP